MAQSTLIDAGPLIALFDKDDSWHSHVMEAVAGFRGSLLTTWPVVTEAVYMLNFSRQAQRNLLEWIDRGGLSVADLGPDHVKRLMALMDAYADVPMDLADASLIAVSETERIETVFTIDSDFQVYRNIRKKHLTNLLGQRKKG